ncbi:AI-2E family transporter [Herpetosiphon gulosus]|uniref:Transport protein Rv0205 n=1 Tax=Herpetosiphon gulosus TaxID=1973496 RepID=A0ABP9X546_9CHLR
MHVQPTSPIRFSPRAKFVTVLSIVIISLYLVNQAWHIMIPFIWAIITAYIFNPVVTWMQRRTKTPRFWWVIVLYIIGSALLTLLVSNVVPIITTQINDLAQAIPTWLEEAKIYVEKHESLTIRGVELINLREAEREISGAIAAFAKDLPGAAPKFLFGIAEGFILTLVYFVVTFYLLLQAETIPNNFYRLIPERHRDEIRQLIGSIDRVLSAYIRGQFLLIIIMSVLSFIALSILQVKYALIIAIATGFLEIIPIIGPYMATAIAALVGFFQGTTPFGWEPWLLALVIIIVYFALRQFEDHFIIPNLVGHIVNVHPVFVIFAILAGGAVAGGLGLLISIPIAAVARIILSYLHGKLVDSPNPQADLVEQEGKLLENHAIAERRESRRNRREAKKQIEGSDLKP